MARFGRFSGKSERESKKIVKEDRGVVSRALSWFAGLGATTCLTGLSNTMATGAWGQTLVVASNAGLVFLGADALLSVEEIAVNKNVFNKKKKAAKKYLPRLVAEASLRHPGTNVDNVDLYSTKEADSELIKDILTSGTGIKTLAFRDKHADVLKQVYVDFEDDKRFENIRETLNLNEAQIKKIQEDAAKSGKISQKTLGMVAGRKSKNAKVLDVVACDEFADRLVDNHKNDLSKFNSRTHLQGALCLTPEQQGKGTNFKLTEEQKFVFDHVKSKNPFKRLFGGAKEKFKKSLVEIQKNLVEGKTGMAFQKQDEILDGMKGYESKRSMADLANLTFKGGRRKNKKAFEKAIDAAATLTSECKIANWKRHVFPLTKKAGFLAKLAINAVQQRLYYRGDYKEHKRRLNRFEKQTKLKFSDVFCQNGTGFRKLRKAYKKQGAVDFIVDYNKNSESKLPNSFACGFVRKGFEDVFKGARSHMLNKISEIKQTQSRKPKTGKNGKEYLTAAYLDEPVVVKINGNIIAGDKSNLPLATFNIDQKDVLRACITGIVDDINRDINSEKTSLENSLLKKQINNIEFVCGNKTRRIYLPQILNAVDAYKNGENMEQTALFRTINGICEEEKFVRVFSEANEEEVVKLKPVTLVAKKAKEATSDAEKDAVSDKVNEKENDANKKAVVTSVVKKTINAPADALTRKDYAKFLTDLKTQNKLVAISPTIEEEYVDSEEAKRAKQTIDKLIEDIENTSLYTFEELKEAKNSDSKKFEEIKKAQTPRRIALAKLKKFSRAIESGEVTQSEIDKHVSLGERTVSYITKKSTERENAKIQAERKAQAETVQKEIEKINSVLISEEEIDELKTKNLNLARKAVKAKTSAKDEIKELEELKKEILSGNFDKSKYNVRMEISKNVQSKLISVITDSAMMPTETKVESKKEESKEVEAKKVETKKVEAKQVKSQKVEAKKEEAQKVEAKQEVKQVQKVEAKQEAKKEESRNTAETKKAKKEDIEKLKNKIAEIEESKKQNLENSLVSSINTHFNIQKQQNSAKIQSRSRKERLKEVTNQHKTFKEEVVAIQKSVDETLNELNKFIADYEKNGKVSEEEVLEQLKVASITKAKITRFKKSTIEKTFMDNGLKSY